MGNKANIVRSLALLGLTAPFVAGPAHAQTDITAFGTNALMSNTTGDYNVAMGVNALRTNTTGSQNTAHGRGALYKNVSGNDNTAVGLSALSGLRDLTTLPSVQKHFRKILVGSRIPLLAAARFTAIRLGMLMSPLGSSR